MTESDEEKKKKQTDGRKTRWDDKDIAADGVHAFVDDIIVKLAADAKMAKGQFVGQEVNKHFTYCIGQRDGDALLPQMKMITLKYPTRCIKKDCGKELNVGEWALYGRGVGAICIDCYVTRIGDKALMAKDIIMHEKLRLIKLYTAEVDRLRGKVEFGQFEEKVDVLFKETSDIHKAINEYFRAGIGTEQDRQQLDEILKRTEPLPPTIKMIQDFILSHRVKPVEKKKVAPYEY
jgi:hypothetical protein